MINNVFIFSAKAEAGKDFCCDLMKQKLEKKGLNVFHIAFADYVRVIANRIYDITDFKTPQGRSIMQELGTNIVRAVDENYWADIVGRLCMDLKQIFDVVLISDARFPNEISVIKDFFPDCTHTILVQRPDILNHDNMTTQQRNHSSETSLDNYKDWDYIITNITGNIENTEQQINNIIEEIYDF